jgi:hypothetical protein
MPKNSSAPAKFDWKSIKLKEPRVLMRVLIGTLLAANLVMAVVAFKPFGGSAEDLRRNQGRLSAQLQRMQNTLDSSKGLVAKMQTARSEGDQFLAKYFIDARSMAAVILSEMTKVSTDAGGRPLGATYTEDPVEGDDTLAAVAVHWGFEGTYANLTKLVNLLEKSPRFLILDTMALNAPRQNGPQAGPQMVNVSLTIITYERNVARATP